MNVGKIKAAMSMAIAVVLLAACQSSRPPRDEFAPYPVLERGSWRVLDGAGQIGRLVLLEIEGHEPPLLYYRAETITGQWAGYAGSTGRVYKLVPFRPVELGPKDTVTLAANHEYAFECGPDGMEFYVVRKGEAGVTYMA